MKLLKLTLKNFRQFYGEQVIEFAKDEKNITVILGENGNGKTGIFRAIVFCLFNKKILPKDKEDKSFVQSKVHLVNLNKLKENINQPVEASVELIFENKGFIYTLVRSVYDCLNENGKVRSDIEINVKLTIQGADGNVIAAPCTKQSDVSIEINKIISEKVKDLFFFDGDKIEALSTTNTASREEIKNGILKLLQIDTVERAVEILEKLRKEQHAQVKNKSNTKLQAEESKIDKLQQDKFNLEQQLDLKKEELNKVILEIERYESEQSESMPIKELLGQRSLYIESRNKSKELILQTKEKIREIVAQKGQTLIGIDSLYKSKRLIEQEEKSNGFQTGVTIELLENILQTKECICGNHIQQDELAYLKIVELKKKYSKVQLSGFLNEFKRNVINELDIKSDIDNQIQKLLFEYNNHMNELDKLKKRIEDIDKEKNKYSQTQERLNALETSLSKCKQDRERYSIGIGIIEKDIEKIGIDIKEKEEQIKSLRKEDKKLKLDNSKLEYYETILNVFKEIRESYSYKMRKKLSMETTNIFYKLIAKKDKDIINQVIINDHYEIQAEGWSDISIFKDISSGQKQMLSLSFVSALAKVASGDGTIINMPLFMDTPFAKLDGNNRDNLILSMPMLTSQWVLLVTDTEFSREEIKQMKETKKWGVFYQLNKIENGYTKIENIHNIEEFYGNR